MFDLAALQAAQDLIRPIIARTPTLAWPLLARRLGCSVWVKHENHSPVGAFKLRGGLVYVDMLRRTRPDITGIVSATRGNHGQSLAFAGCRAGLKVTIVVPVGNSREKNAAMRALGADLIEHGHDFEAARQEAMRLAEQEGWHPVPSFHADLVRGVATYALELFQTVEALDTVYVPIGMGSGVAGLIRTRDLLGLKTDIVGVVATGADAYAQSFEAGRVIGTETARTFADGMACRAPSPEVLDILRAGAARIVRVSDDEIAAALRALHEDTHNMAEGAGAAALAAALQERPTGKRVAVILTGANIDREEVARVLA